MNRRSIFKALAGVVAAPVVAALPATGAPLPMMWGSAAGFLGPFIPMVNFKGAGGDRELLWHIDLPDELEVQCGEKATLTFENLSAEGNSLAVDLASGVTPYELAYWGA